MSEDAASIPRSFTEVAGWRESFREAAKRLDVIRTGSLFPDIPDELCGERVRLLTLTDWVVLDHAQNPFIAGGQRTVEHALNILWQVSPLWRENGTLARFLRRFIAFRVLARHRFNGEAVIEAVADFVDDAFLDSPCNFSSEPSKRAGPVDWPRKSFAVEFAGQVMETFPQFTFDEIRKMPLAQFWQWLHEARSRKNPDYRNHQLTDHVNGLANNEVNRLRKEQLNTKNETQNGG